MEIRPQAPKNGIFSKKFFFFENVSRFRFQRALNHPQILNLSQVMQKNTLSKKLNLGLQLLNPEWKSYQSFT